MQTCRVALVASGSLSGHAAAIGREGDVGRVRSRTALRASAYGWVTASPSLILRSIFLRDPGLSETLVSLVCPQNLFPLSVHAPSLAPASLREGRRRHSARRKSHILAQIGNGHHLPCTL